MHRNEVRLFTLGALGKIFVQLFKRWFSVIIKTRLLFWVWRGFADRRDRCCRWLKRGKMSIDRYSLCVGYQWESLIDSTLLLLSEAAVFHLWTNSRETIFSFRHGPEIVVWSYSSLFRQFGARAQSKFHVDSLPIQCASYVRKTLDIRFPRWDALSLRLSLAWG